MEVEVEGEECLGAQVEDHQAEVQQAEAQQAEAHQEEDHPEEEPLPRHLRRRPRHLQLHQRWQEGMETCMECPQPCSPEIAK